VKIAATIAVLGVGINTEVAGDGITDKLKRVAGIMATMAFTALAIITWYKDIVKIIDVAPQLTNRGEMFLVIALTWSCSGNLPASISVGLSVVMFNPMKLFYARPLYSCHVFGYPLYPGQVDWLPWHKHIYFLVLLPYFAPFCLARWSLRSSLVSFFDDGGCRGFFVRAVVPSWTLAGMVFMVFLMCYFGKVFIMLFWWVFYGFLTVISLTCWTWAKENAAKCWAEGVDTLCMLIIIITVNKLAVFLGYMFFKWYFQLKEGTEWFQHYLVGIWGVEDYFTRQIGRWAKDLEDVQDWGAEFEKGEPPPENAVVQGLDFLATMLTGLMKDKDGHAPKETISGSGLKAFIGIFQMEATCTLVISVQIMTIVMAYRWVENDGKFLQAFRQTLFNRTLEKYFGGFLTEDQLEMINRFWTFL